LHGDLVKWGSVPMLGVCLMSCTIRHSAYSKRVPDLIVHSCFYFFIFFSLPDMRSGVIKIFNCALRIKKCAPRISSGIYFSSTS